MRPRTHNVLSYSGAVLVFWGVLLYRASHAGWSRAAGFAAALWTFHFLRRAYESALVHRYSKARIEPGDYSTEYAYYWGFAAWIAWSVSSPTYREPGLLLQSLGLVGFLVAERGNARAHRLLRDLREPGSSLKRIPRGFLFERLSCPHYFFEILSWVGFNLVTGTLAGTVFLLVGAGILAAWARTRHLAYQREFDGREGRELYPPERRALIPFLF
jgi:very-long-chain enoyl-CoA reductase